MDSTKVISTTPLSVEIQSIEESILNKKNRQKLPLESTISRNKFRPKTVLENRTLFNGLKTSYDLTHRKTFSRNRPKDEIQDSSLVEMYASNGKPWIAKRRMSALNLIKELENMIQEAQKNSRNSSSEIEEATSDLDSGINAHLSVLNSFLNISDNEYPERSELITKLSSYYQQVSSQLPEIRNTFEEAYLISSEALEKSIREKISLQKEYDISLSNVEKYRKSIEALKQQIAEYRQKLITAETQLRDIINDKSAMSRSSQTNQQKLLDIENQLEEKRKQKLKLNELVDTLAKEIKERSEELQQSTTDLNGIEQSLGVFEKQIDGFKSIINDRKALLNKLKSTPLRDNTYLGRFSTGIQVNRLPKREPKEVLTEETQNKDGITGQEQFKQIKSDMIVAQRVLDTKGEPIVITQFDDLMKVRKAILKNNGIFDYCVESISGANQGDFLINRSSIDQSRLFSEWIIERVMNKAVSWKSRIHNESQTDAIEAINESTSNNNPSIIEEKVVEKFKFSPKSLLPFLKQSRLATLLKTDESSRPPKPIDWLIHSIRSIYDEKTIDDRTNLRKGMGAFQLPEYLLIWAFRQFGKDDLIQKGCWDIFISSHFHIQRYLEISMFVHFLDENWTCEQLSFFLSCRAWILERSISIATDNLELKEYLTETYLTKTQVADFFKYHFPNTEPELVQDLIIRGCSCSDQSRGNEDEVATIPMNRILELAIGEQHDEKIRRFRRMLAFYRPIPRMTLKRFHVFCRSLIVNIDPNMIDSLYRSSLVHNLIRKDMIHEQFSSIFKSNGPILPINYNNSTISCESFAHYSPLYSLVLTRWGQFSAFLTRMISSIQKIKNDEAKIMVNEIRHEVFQLLEAKFTFDGVLFYQSYHRVLQIVFESCLKLNLPDPSGFSQQIIDFERHLTKKYSISIETIDHNDN